MSDALAFYHFFPSYCVSMDVFLLFISTYQSYYTSFRNHRGHVTFPEIVVLVTKVRISTENLPKGTNQNLDQSYNFKTVKVMDKTV